MNEHPLWPYIREEVAKLPVLYPPFDASGRYRTRKLDPYTRRQLQEVHIASKCLLITLEGDSAPSEHELPTIFHFCCQHPLGPTIAKSIYHAGQLGLHEMKAFMVSTRLEGFLDAVAAWSNRFGQKKQWEERLKIIVSKLGNDPELDEVNLREALQNAPSPREFFQQLVLIANRAEAAQKKQKQRGKSPRRSKFKPLLLRNWLTNALWCRSTAGILLILDSRSSDAIKDQQTIDKDISRLGLARFRRPGHEKEIEDAERNHSDYQQLP